MGDPDASSGGRVNRNDPETVQPVYISRTCKVPAAPVIILETRNFRYPFFQYGIKGFVTVDWISGCASSIKSARMRIFSNAICFT